MSLLSTISAVTELGVTAAVFTYLYGAHRGRPRTGLVAFALTYETLINVAYMTFRLIVPAHGDYSSGMSLLLAFHGTISLIMLVGLVAFVAAIHRAHRNGQNLVAAHPRLTWTFVAAWSTSILTGELVYVLIYL